MNTTAQESASVKGYSSNKALLNCSFGMGTFAAGENLGGSAFMGGLLSADWKYNKNEGLSYGLETGLLGGETKGNIIYGFPAIFRLGWYPRINNNEKIDFFVLVKIGWAFGIWNSLLEKRSSPNGIVGGLNFGGRYFLTPLVDIYTELGYSYYGLARSRNHPEYPLGYGSGKLYGALGFSLKFGKHQ